MYMVLRLKRLWTTIAVSVGTMTGTRRYLFNVPEKVI